jgi:hypothetical protein
LFLRFFASLTRLHSGAKCATRRSVNLPHTYRFAQTKETLMFRNLFRSRRSLNKPGRPVRRPYQPCIEIFEDRLVPSTTWTGLSPLNHNWSNADNWNNGVPGAGDTAIFTTHSGSSTAVVDAAFSVVLDIEAHWGGNIQIDNPLTTTGSSKWASGTMTLGAGGWTNSGTLLLAGAIPKTLDGQNLANPLTNTGMVTWTDGSNLQTGNAAAINNNGTWDMQNNQAITPNFGAMSTFTNSGTLRKLAGLTASSINITFNNMNGTIDVQTGILNLSSGTSTGGTFNVANNGQLNLTGGGTQNITGTYIGSGSGHIDFSGGTINVLNAGATFNFDPGLFQWTGGALTREPVDTATLTNSGTLLITGNQNDKVINGAIFITTGTTIWTGTGNIQTGNAAQITNSGTWDIQNAQALSHNFGTVSTFTNTSTGTVTKDGPGTTSIGITFNNNGTVNVASGVLQLGGGGLSAGTFNPDTGTVSFVGGTQTLTTGANLTGAGVVRVAGGTLNVNADVAEANVAVVSGTLGGTNTLTVSGQMDWTGGTLAGPGTTVLGPSAALALTGASPKVLDGRTLTNTGTVTWTGDGNLQTGNAAAINNNGTWDMQNNQAITPNFGTMSTFTNSGTLRKSAGITTSAISILFNNNNNAIIDVQTGIVVLSSGTSTGGNYSVATNALLDLTGGGTQNITGTYTGSGSGVIEFSAGTINVLDAGATFNFSPALQWTGGTLTREPVDTATLTNSGTLLITGNQNDKVINGAIFITTGTTTWTGTRNIQTGNAAQITNSGTWDIQNAQALSHNFGTVSTFTNTSTATVTKAVAGTTFIGITFNNNGTVNVASGVLQVGGGGTDTGAFNGITGSTLQFSGGTHTLNTGTALPSAGRTQVTGGEIDIRDVVAVQDFGLLNGTLRITSTGIFNVGGIYNQTTNGSLVIEIGGTTAGAGYGQLNVTGTASLAGSFTAVLVNDFAPSIGDSYAVITYGSRNGLFNNVFLPGLPPDRRWDTGNEYGPTGFTLTVIAQ